MEKLEEFKKLGLGEKTIKALSKKGYEKPTPIQALTSIVRWRKRYNRAGTDRNW